jgi:hypothetical protein
MFFENNLKYLNVIMDYDEIFDNCNALEIYLFLIGNRMEKVY